MFLIQARSLFEWKIPKDPLYCLIAMSCCSLRFSSPSTKLKNKLQVMQNKMVRFILKLGPRSHLGDEELKRAGMLKVEDRVKQLKLNHVFKIFNEVAPEYLIFTSPNLSPPIDTIPGAVQLIFLFQTLRVSSAILFSMLVFGNGTYYQLMSKPAKLIFILKRQSKATFYHN